MICKHIKDAFVEMYGEEVGTKQFERAIKLSTMTDEEIKAENEKMERDNPWITPLADALRDIILGVGTKQ